MNFFYILASLGALAWLPHLIHLLRKPQLIINSHEEIEIGYDIHGPKLNIMFAFSSDYKDSFIEKIDLASEHEDKETHNFSWSWFEEELAQVYFPQIGHLPYTKGQKAIAIQVATDLLAEKKVRFNEIKFKQQFNTLSSALDIIHNNYYSSTKDLNELKSVKEYKDFLDLYENSFCWKVGNYSISMKVYIRKRPTPFEHNFDFKLTRLNIEKLKRNIKGCKSFWEAVYITQDSESLKGWEQVTVLKI